MYKEPSKDELTLIEAAYWGSIETIKELLKKGTDVNARNSFGVTPLIACNNKETIELLLKHGANVRLRDRYGDSALTKALKRECESMIALLKEHGARE